MKEKKQKFNHVKFNALVDEVFENKSIRKSVSNLRPSLYRWRKGDIRHGPNEKSWDNIIYLFSQEKVYIKKSDFYGDEEVYDFEKMTENVIPINEYEHDPNMLNNPLISDLIQRVYKLEEAFEERCQRVVELHHIIQQKDNKIKEYEENFKLQEEKIKALQENLNKATDQRGQK